MKIVHVLESTATGVLSMVAQIANEQVKKGDKVIVVYSIRPESPSDIRKYFDAEVDLNHIQMMPIALSFRSGLSLRRLLQNIRPDIVHLHSSFAGFLGRIFLFDIGCKIFYSPHCISFQRKDIGAAKRLVFILLERFANIFGGVYIACSSSEGESISRNVKGAQVRLVENCLSDYIVNRGVSSCDKNKMQNPSSFSIVNVAQIRPQKNPYLFMEVCSNVKDFFRDDDVDIRFIWVGDGDTKTRFDLERSGVAVTGWLDRSEVLSVIEESSIFLSTSSWEGLPIALMEAAVFGKICLVSSVDGNTDVIRDQYNGYLFHSADQAAEHIINIVSKGLHSYRDMSINASREAAARYSSSSMVIKLYDAYGVEEI